MRLAELVSSALKDRFVLDEINALLEVKMRAGESTTSPRGVGIHDFIEAELADAMAYTPDKGSKADGSQLDQYLHAAVMQFDTKT